MYKHYKNGFYVSDKGKVIRVCRNKRNKVDLYTSKNGYFYFIIFNDPNKPKVYLHRAVAELFINKPKGKYIVDHIDRNKKNNNATNLRWVTSSENRRNC